MKRYKTTILIAAGIFVLDAFVLNQGAIAIFVILLTFFVFVPRALWALRTSRALYLERLTRAGIYLLAAAAVFAANVLQNRMADHRAIELGKACLAYHAKYQHYPQRLDELVPEFIPSVPPAKYTLAGGSFFYSASLSGKEPMLYYQALPPFGRRFYHLETGGWGYLD
ncbi:MAG: hypothetical protein WB755_23630 [Terriglobales bacterium]|jgi:hypothetical protein